MARIRKIFKHNSLHRQQRRWIVSTLLGVRGIVLKRRRISMANQNQPDQPKGVQSSTGQSGSSGSSGSQGNYTFRCADVGYKECPWQTRGSSEDEVMRNAEQHGRDQHQITNMDETTRNKVRSNIRRAA
jgi:predicted small metal-binding protein